MNNLVLFVARCFLAVSFLFAAWIMCMVLWILVTLAVDVKVETYF